MLTGLLLLALLAPWPLHAQTNTAKAALSANRWLFIVETSRPMQRRANAALKTVQDLLNSSMGGQMRQGDTLGLWTFNEELYAGRFSLQRWSPEVQGDIAQRMLTYLKAQKYEKQPNLAKVIPTLARIVESSPLLTIILVTSGEEKMHGTPFDAQINEFYQKWHGEQQKARMPFVIVLRVTDGQVVQFTANTPPWAVQIPIVSHETQSADAAQGKPLEAQTNATPFTGSSLVFSGKKHQPEKTTAPKPEATGVNVAAPAPVLAANTSNQSLTARPSGSAAQPAQAAKTPPAPVIPDKPPLHLSPTPPPPTMPAPVLNAEVVKAPGTKPAPPAPAAPAAALAPPAPPPAPPPASAPAAAAVSAAAVPGEGLANHRNLWVAGIALAVIAAGFALLLRRRSRTGPGASLITQSIEREKKP